jgi:hypothetical protein
VAEDFAETHNIAAENRDKLSELIAEWYVEADKYNVFPIDGSGLARMVAEKPLVAPLRDRYVYRAGTQSIPFFAGPRVLNRPRASPQKWRSPRTVPRECFSARALRPAATRST